MAHAGIVFFLWRNVSHPKLPVFAHGQAGTTRGIWCLSPSGPPGLKRQLISPAPQSGPGPPAPDLVTQVGPLGVCFISPFCPSVSPVWPEVPSVGFQPELNSPLGAAQHRRGGGAPPPSGAGDRQRGAPPARAGGGGPSPSPGRADLTSGCTLRGSQACVLGRIELLTFGVEPPQPVVVESIRPIPCAEEAPSV